MKWEKVDIASFAKKRENYVKVEPSTIYPLLGLRLEGNGLFVREKKQGLEISSSKLSKLIDNDFIYSRLFAWKGAFDKVTTKFDGLYVSNEFPSFEIDNTRVNVDFLRYYFHQAKVWSEVEQYCMGITKASRNRFKEQFFMDLKIPLPPLAEQQRIVAKLDEAKAKVAAIAQLRQAQTADLKNLLYSHFVDLSQGATYLPMGEVAPVVRKQIKIKPEGQYPELGVRGFGRGIFHKPILNGADLTWQKLYEIQEGDLVISNIKAWEGALAVAGKADHQMLASHRYLTCKANPNLLLPDFLCAYLLYPEGLEKIQLASPGSADRNRTLAVKRLEAIEVPVPSLAKQRAFVALQAQVKQMQATQQANDAQLEQLMPSLLDKAFAGAL